MNDLFNDCRQEHSLTNDEVGLFTGIAVKQNPDYEEVFEHVQSKTLDLRTLVDRIELPQKAGELKTYNSNIKKLEKFSGQIDRAKAQIKTQQEKIDAAQEKIQTLTAKVEDLEGQMEVIEQLQGELGPAAPIDHRIFAAHQRR